jgi:hypothetical protein
MPLEQPLIDPRFNGWVVRLWLNLVDDTTQFKSVAVREWLEHVSGRNI